MPSRFVSPSVLGSVPSLFMLPTPLLTSTFFDIMVSSTKWVKPKYSCVGWYSIGGKNKTLVTIPLSSFYDVDINIQ
jgi:hypothetical protein